MDEVKLDIKTIQLCYVYSIVFVMVFDYDKYYATLYKNALKYGMSKYDFWNENYEDYFIYEEAYYERLHETQHIGGLYNFRAICSALGNKDSNDKPITYPVENYYQQQKQQIETKKINENKPLRSFKSVKKKDVARRQIQELAHCY